MDTTPRGHHRTRVIRANDGDGTLHARATANPAL